MTEQTQESTEQRSTEQTEEQRSTEQRSERREPQEQNVVPSHRLREETEKRRQAEQRLQELEQKETEREEKSAKEQGEWQQVAEKRQEKVQRLEKELADLKAQVTRDARHRAFSRAANGILLSEAVDDAFEMLSEEDLKDASLEDENSWTALAQRIAERKPYLADGVRGSGSGGSGRPALSGQRNGSQTKEGRGRSAIADMKSRQNRRKFK